MKKSIELNSGIKPSYDDLLLDLQKRDRRTRITLIFMIIILVTFIVFTSYALIINDSENIINQLNNVAIWLYNL